jgi:phosphoglycerol transferase
MTDLGVTYLLLLSFGLALVIVLFPELRPHRYALASALALVVAGLLGGRALGVQPGWAMVPLLAAALLLIPAVTIARGFGQIDVIAMLFHSEFGLQGANLSSLRDEFLAALAASGLLLLSAAGLCGYWRHEVVLGPLLAALLVAVNPVLRCWVRWLLAGPVTSVLPDRMVAPSLRPGPVPLPDLVILYLEGTDRRFADAAQFGSLARKLDNLAAEGVSFTRVGQIAGTGWSLAGMAASQSGVPIPPRPLRFRLKLEEVTRFMPGVTFLTDVLAAKGYNSHYVVGGETGFGGIGAMYDTHRIGAMTGRAEMQASFPAAEFEAAQVDWFLDDQMVLDAARQLHRDLVREARPFALIVETIGPHGPKGYVSRRNTASGRAGKPAT